MDFFFFYSFHLRLKWTWISGLGLMWVWAIWVKRESRIYFCDKEKRKVTHVWGPGVSVITSTVQVGHKAGRQEGQQDRNDSWVRFLAWLLYKIFQGNPGNVRVGKLKKKIESKIKNATPNKSKKFEESGFEGEKQEPGQAGLGWIWGAQGGSTKTVGNPSVRGTFQMKEMGEGLRTFLCMVTIPCLWDSQ